jgi:WD40 repeat protein
MGSVTTLSFLDPISLKTIKTMPFNGVAFMSLTGQGKYILGRAKDGSASVFESESGRLICRLPKETAGNLGASEDGKVFAREDQDYRTLHVFDSGGREVWKHKLNSASFFDAVSPNGKLVATGLYTGDVDIFDAATGKVVRELTEPSMCIRALAFSRDSRLLAVGGDEATVFIYNLEKPGPPVECNVNAGDLLFLSFSPDGSRLLATGLNQLASLWDSRTGDEVMTFGDSSSKVNRAMFNQSGDQICTLDEHSVLHVYRAP